MHKSFLDPTREKTSFRTFFGKSLCRPPPKRLWCQVKSRKSSSSFYFFVAWPHIHRSFQSSALSAWTVISSSIMMDTSSWQKK